MNKRQRKYNTSEQSFSRPFLSSSADDSQGLKVCTREGEAPAIGVSLPETPWGKPKKELLGCGEGVAVRLLLLEGAIHDFAITGDSRGLMIRRPPSSESRVGT